MNKQDKLPNCKRYQRKSTKK